MAVTRIVKNIATPDPGKAQAFYGDILGLDIAMDFGWITTFSGDARAQVQLSVASEGGSGTEVPDISIEVDNFEEILTRIHTAGMEIPYGPVTEPWGVRRFYVCNPFGTLLNILTHET